jgi:hypothetical protein
VPLLLRARVAGAFFVADGVFRRGDALGDLEAGVTDRVAAAADLVRCRVARLVRRGVGSRVGVRAEAEDAVGRLRGRGLDPPLDVVPLEPPPVSERPESFTVGTCWVVPLSVVQAAAMRPPPAMKVPPKNMYRRRVLAFM